MIVERLALGMAKNLNLSVEFAFGEGLNGTFGTNGKEEKPILYWIGFDLDWMRNNAEFKSPRCLRVFCNDLLY